MMNVCKVSATDLNEVDMVIKIILREKQVYGRQSSDERFYLSRDWVIEV